MYKAEHLSCLIDNGHIKSIGRFVTGRGETLEVGLCPFDGSFSGFRWNEETGWEAIFVRQHTSTKDAGVISICNWTENNPYSADEIALELKRCVAAPRSPGSA
jgi:hypothetical protein